MKVLIISTWIKENLLSLSASEKSKLLESTMEWFQKHKETGKCLEVYSDMFGEHMVTVWEIEPHEGLMLTMDCPTYNYATATYFPIIDTEVLVSQIKKLGG